MEKDQIVRAWKDASYRSQASETHGASLPDHPSGRTELDELDLDNVSAGGTIIITLYTWAWKSYFEDGTCAVASLGCC